MASSHVVDEALKNNDDLTHPLDGTDDEEAVLVVVVEVVNVYVDYAGAAAATTTPSEP